MMTELIKNKRSPKVMEENILIVDDINDTGATFEWIRDDWKLEKLHKVKFATLTENPASKFEHVS